MSIFHNVLTFFWMERSIIVSGSSSVHTVMDLLSLDVLDHFWTIYEQDRFIVIIDFFKVFCINLINYFDLSAISFARLSINTFSTVFFYLLKVYELILQKVYQYCDIKITYCDQGFYPYALPLIRVRATTNRYFHHQSISLSYL